jgi:ADP-heptose:LPS heptosyltransferase
VKIHCVFSPKGSKTLEINSNQKAIPALLIKTDCRGYRGSMPCILHKKDAMVCENCSAYDPIKTRILIIKLGAIGDVLRTTSILPALLRKYPGAEITWITKANATPLLQGNPRIDRLLSVEEDYLEYLHNERFSLGICLDADLHSATINSIADCQEKLGFVADRSGKIKPASDTAVEWWLMGLNDGMKRQNRKTYQHIMYEICQLPFPVQRPELHLNNGYELPGQKLREETSLCAARKIVGINTGGGGRWQLKKWTAAGYIDCIRLLKKKLPDIGLLLLGGPEEADLNREIMEAVGDSVVDGGCLNSLLEFAGKVKAVDVLFTADSLAMHVGVALEIPTIVVVGPTSPWELDVFGKGAVLHSDLDCLACYRTQCDKVVNCMNSLSPEHAFTKISEYL